MGRWAIRASTSDRCKTHTRKDANGGTIYPYTTTNCPKCKADNEHRQYIREAIKVMGVKAARMDAPKLQAEAERLAGHKLPYYAGSAW